MTDQQKPPAKFGPFHRKCYDPRENERISNSGQIRGRPRRNIYAGDFPAVKAFDGPLPPGFAGIEFYTDVEPDPWSVPGQPDWSEGRSGVITIERKEIVAIPVIIVRRVDPDANRQTE